MLWNMMYTWPCLLQCENTGTSAGDGIDNDCDGRVDEERKDGKDNDNDGKVDEDLDLVNKQRESMACSAGRMEQGKNLYVGGFSHELPQNCLNYHQK